jgi:uncharacterized surface protein with fasciclin (FAS1) repeats
MKKYAIFRSSIFALFTTVLVTVGCSDDDAPQPQSQTITDIVVNNPDFTILKAAVTKAGLANALATGSLTVFAPDNAAFGNSGITEAAINSLPVSTVDSILKYHVLGSKVTAADVPASDAVATLLGTKVFASKNANGVFMNGVKVKTADLSASNGVIHVIEKVLIPPTKTIAELAANDTSFSFLVVAVQKAGLLNAISAPGKFTVFAPTNAAFRAAGIYDINAVEQATVETVVKYHVLATNVFASDLINNSTAATLQGGTITVSTTPAAAVKITSSSQPVSNIVAANIVATNGVIHVIDRTLLP